MKMTEARASLAKVWFTGGLFFLLVIIVQTILGAYGPDAEKAWGWALPTIMPTLLLIVGVLVAQNKDNLANAKVDPFLFKLTLGLSIFYLVVVNLPILLAPFTNRTKIEVMQSCSLFLGPLQGLVGAAFGAFFIARKDDTTP